MLTVEAITPFLAKELPRHAFYQDSLKIAEALQVHSKGKSPEAILDIARPNEAPEYKQYRKDVWKPITKTYFSKVLTTIAKINRAEDWDIAYNPDIKENPFRKYMEEDYPFFDSFSNWFFSLCLNSVADDPMAVAALMPTKITDVDNEMPELFTFVFDSDQVVEYQEREMVVLLDREKSELESGGQKVKEGRILHVFDRQEYWRISQTGSVNDDPIRYDIVKIKHNIGYVPAQRLGGLVKDFKEGNILYDSFLSACMPFWDEAVARYSDHQVNMVLHLHPDQWEIADKDCTAKGCKDGKIQERNHLGALVQHKCNTCNGSGKIVTRTPFGRRILQPTVTAGLNNVTAIPTPPAGYIDRPIESISFLKQEYMDDIKQGLQALNMEWLMNEPELNSGIAKEFDKQELNTFIYTIGRHLIENIFKPFYWFHCKWRFGKVAGHEKLLPVIAIPEKFDLMTADVAGRRLATAKEKKFSPIIVTRLEADYARKQGNETEAMIIETIQKLDPLPYLSSTEKNDLVINSDNKGTSYLKYVISSNLPAYINRALFEKKDFLSQDYKQQMDLVKKYAKEDIDEEKGNAFSDVKTDVMGNLTDTPVDVEKEAKAKLKGSVGGVQGILEIQKSVSEGITDYSAALSILDLIYGMDDAAGRRILGDPKKVKPAPVANDQPPAITT